MKPILSLDFDGVIHAYTTPWEAADIIPDPPVEGAMYFIFKALKKFEVHIYSGRSHQLNGIYAMRKYIKKHMMMIFPLKDARDIVYNKIKFPRVKPNAIVHIDDRAFLFKGEWPDIDELLRFKPWNKKEYEDVHNGY